MGRGFEFSVSDKCHNNVGFENPTYVYVFGFVRGLSPRYVCCVQTEWRFKFQTTFRGCIRIPVSDKCPDNVEFENPAYVFGFIRGQSPRYVCCVQTGWRFKFQTTFRGCIRIPVSDKCPDNVGFKNPAYVFGFVRGQSPRYICCVKTGRDYKFQTTFGAVGRILESDILNLNRFNNFSDDLPFEKVV